MMTLKQCAGCKVTRCESFALIAEDIVNANQGDLKTARTYPTPEAPMLCIANLSQLCRTKCQCGKPPSPFIELLADRRMIRTEDWKRHKVSCKATKIVRMVSEVRREVPDTGQLANYDTKIAGKRNGFQA